MKQGRLLWSPCHHSSPPSLPFTTLTFQRTKHASAPFRAALDSIETQEQQQQQLTARERRQLRNERRESKFGYSWREEVEDRLIKKPKKKPMTASEKLNLDNLALLGPQWWIVRVSRARGHLTADVMARLLSRNFPDIEFKVYVPAVEEKRKLKNGTLSIKEKPIFPGCVFLWCELNREIHDFIRECDGVGGFLGFKVGNMKRTINKPSPVSNEDMETIFRQAKEEQETYDQALQEEQQGVLDFVKIGSSDAKSSVSDSKPKRGSRKVSSTLANGSSRSKTNKLTSGSPVRVVSGTFAQFTGNVKKISRKTGKATVGFTLFGKESLVDLDLDEIVAE